jgi:hypothetical protein
MPLPLSLGLDMRRPTQPTAAATATAETATHPALGWRSFDDEHLTLGALVQPARFHRRVRVAVVVHIAVHCGVPDALKVQDVGI